MSNDIINWRFGYVHLHIGKWYLTIEQSTYWKNNKPKKWFERY